jgi:hypothetical protein
LPSGYAIFYHRRLFQTILLLFQHAFEVIESTDGSLALSVNDESTLDRLRENPELIDAFARLVAKYVRNETGSSLRRPDNDYRTIVSMRQVAATELFFAAHEFGHILERQDNTALVTLEVRGFSETFLLGGIAHDWGQELRADLTGYSLAKRASFSSYLGEPSSPAEKAAGAYAPIAFLALADVLEDAIFCDASGVGTKQSLDLGEKQRLLDFALRSRSGTSTEADPSPILGCRKRGHPPAWIRAELLQDSADAQFAQNLATKPGPFGLTREAGFYRLYVRGIEVLHSLARPKIRRLLTGPYKL